MNKSLQFRNAMLALSVFGVAALVLFGIVGFGRADGSAFSDVRYWRTSTGLWLEGGNPYDIAQLVRYALGAGYDDIANYAYPPTAFWMGLPLLGMSPTVAGWMWTGVNLLALAGIIAGCSRLLAAIAGRACSVSEIALLVTVLAGSPYTANVIWTGQSTLVVSCALVWSWVLAYSGRSLLAGVFLALASAKPQLVLLPALWLLLDRRWKVLFSAAGTAAALSAIPVVTTGIATFTQWLQATTAYMNETTVVLLLSHNLNLASVAKAFAWPGSAQLGAVFMAAGVGFTLIFYRRLRLKPDAFVIALGVLVPLSLLSFYGRDYDLAACGPTLALAMYVSRRSKADMALGILLVGALNIPHRVVEKIEPTYLIYWRPVLLLATVIWLVSWTSSRSVRHRAAPLPA